MSTPYPPSQPHRTGLAWTRTALACSALAAVALKAAVGHHRPLDVMTAALAALAAAAVYGCGRYRAARPADSIGAAVMALALGVCLLANLAATITLATG